MDDLNDYTPCLCAACGRPALTAGHTCDPEAPPSVLEGVVRLTLRRQLIATMAKRRRGRR